MKSINPRTIDLNLLRMFLAISETGSVTRAGAQLGLSQPASSNALARLRASLDDLLFVRTGAGMQPTRYAETVLPDIKRHLGGIFDTLTHQAGFDPLRSSRVFKLSMSGLGEAVFLPRLAIRTLKKAPNTKINNVSVLRSQLPASLETGETDLAIGMINIKGRGIRSVTLFEEEYVAIVGAGNRQLPQTIDDLKQARLVVSAPAATYGKDINDSLSRAGLIDNIVLRLSHFGALPMLLHEIDLVAIVPRQLAVEMRSAGHAAILPISLKPRFTRIKMIWHDKTEFDAACMWFRRQVIELFAEDKATKD